MDTHTHTELTKIIPSYATLKGNIIHISIMGWGGDFRGGTAHGL